MALLLLKPYLLQCLHSKHTIFVELGYIHGQEAFRFRKTPNLSSRSSKVMCQHIEYRSVICIKFTNYMALHMCESARAAGSVCANASSEPKDVHWRTCDECRREEETRRQARRARWSSWLLDQGRTMNLHTLCKRISSKSIMSRWPVYTDVSTREGNRSCDTITLGVSSVPSSLEWSAW